MLPRIFCLGLISAFLCRAAYAGPDQWIEVRSPHFTVVTDAGEKQGRHIADQFDRMRWLFQALYPTANVDPAESTVVIAAKNEKVFETMEPAPYLAKGQMKLGGYYAHSQEKNYILLQLDTQYEHPFATVYHEYTHLQFAFASAWMPLWLNEGLAEFMQNTEIRDKEVLLGEPSADDILYLRQNNLIPLSVLFKIDAHSPYYHEEQKGSAFYAEAWALTHLLMVTDHNKHTNQIGTYMSLVSSGQDSLAAAEKAFGDLAQLQKALENYIHQASYTEFVLSSAAAPIDESTYTVRLLTQVEIDARRADVLTFVSRESEARTLLDSVLKEDPNNVLAHETMGTLELRAGHRDEARKWYGEAVNLDSKDYLAYFYFASLSMNAPPGPDDTAIEDSLRKAIQLNPRFAPSYDRLAVFYSMRHENLDEAHLLSVKAVELDPSQVVFRQNCANVLMALQRYDDAANVLKAAEKVAKNPGQVSSVQFQIEQIERFQKQRAEAETYRSTHSGDTPANSNGTTEIVTVAADQRPKHPTVAKDAAKHTAVGVIHDVACSYPMVVEFKLTTAAGKSLSLYNNQMQSIDLSAFGFTPSGSMNPCSDFEGEKAKVEFAESPDKSVDGQVIAIELRK
jgi:Tfp pilus assembly protein PilF